MAEGGAAVPVGVIGVGHLGKQHARIYGGHPGAQLVGVADLDLERARAVAEPLGVPAFSDYRELLAACRAASVVVPTGLHREVASACIARGVHVLVEKPLARDLAEAEAIRLQAEAAGVILQVGHVERFNPAVEAALGVVRNPRYIECDRVAPFSFRSQDIGVVLDLMIHDLDIVLSLVPAEIASVEAIGVPVLSRTEDIANARIVFEGGCVATLTASRVALKRERKLRIFQDDAYVTIDTAAQRTVVTRRRPGPPPPEDVDLAGVGDVAAYVLEKFISVEEVAIERGEPLARELASFLGAVRTGGAPVVGGEEGCRAMRAAGRILEAIRARPA